MDYNEGLISNIEKDYLLIKTASSEEKYFYSESKYTSNLNLGAKVKFKFVYDPIRGNVLTFIKKDDIQSKSTPTKLEILKLAVQYVSTLDNNTKSVNTIESVYSELLKMYSRARYE